MKILILTQNVKDTDGMKAGLTKAQSLLSKIGLQISFDYKETIKQFTTIPLNTDVVQNGYEVNPSDIISEMQPGYNVTCLIYDWNFTFPHATNPCTNESKSFTNTPMQIPVNFYSNLTVTPTITYPDILVQFFLHEISHYIPFITNNPDYTHSQFTSAFNDWHTKQPTDFYLFLIQGLVKYIPQPVPVVTITRTSDNGIQTLGDLNFGSFNCKTIERPWKNNQHNISCIPKGTYHCTYTFSLTHLGWTYQVNNVPNRSGIRIHSANYYTDLEGCIGLGSGYEDINKDGQLDAINSKLTVNNFVTLLNKKDFTLIIK